MSNVFGPVVQQGYVVPDIDKAIEHWTARGVGPFFVEHLKDFDGVVDGEAKKLELKAGFAYSGDQQIEIIQPCGDEACIYEEYLKTNPAGGLQHLAVWVDSIEDKLTELKDKGMNYTVRQRYGDGHAYIDSEDQPGVMIQLMARGEAIEAMFDIVKAGAEDWDGKTDPARSIDWSSGQAVIVPYKSIEAHSFA